MPELTAKSLRLRVKLPVQDNRAPYTLAEIDEEEIFAFRLGS